MNQSDFLAGFWDGLLSREPDKIRAAYQTLDADMQQIVLAHLQRMVNEEGWHPEQRRSAQSALDALTPPAPPVT